MTRLAKLQVFLLALFLGTVFIAVSRFRLIDGDEGFYLLASKLVFQGKTLYRDFFYTQMPLLPFVFGAWMKIGGETWNAARLLSSLFATALGCLLYWHVGRTTGSGVAGWLAALLFVSSTPVVVWLTVAKSYSLSTLLLFGAYLAVAEGSSKWALAFSGFLLALSADTRLYLAGIAPALLLAIYWRRSAFPHLPAAYAWFLGGLALGLSPNLYWIVQSPGNYYFNNLGYHGVRSEAGLVGAYFQKIHMLFKVSGLIQSPEGNGLPFGLLLLLNGLWFPIHRRLHGPRVWPAICIAATVILLSVLPTPAYQQYFCVAVPFLIVGAIFFAWNLLPSRGGQLALLGVLIANLSFLPSDLRRYTSIGIGLMGGWVARARRVERFWSGAPPDR